MNILETKEKYSCKIGDESLDNDTKVKKYKLTEESRIKNNKTLYRIQALKSFGDVKEGDLGGWIEKEDNLSQFGMCWIYDDACAYNNARILDNARVEGLCVIHSNAIIHQNAILKGKCIAKGYAKIGGNALFDEKIIIGGTSTFNDTFVCTGKAKFIGRNKRSNNNLNNPLYSNEYQMDNYNVAKNASKNIKKCCKTLDK